MNTIELKCGVILELKAVNPAILRSIIANFDGVEKIAKDPQSLLNLSGPKQIKAMEAAEKLYTYCFGWGVTTDPPEDDPILALAPDNPPARRGMWVRNIGADDKELGEIIGRVMALTFGNQQTAVGKQERIAKIQEQLNETYAGTNSGVFAVPGVVW